MENYPVRVSDLYNSSLVWLANGDTERALRLLKLIESKGNNFTPDTSFHEIKNLAGCIYIKYNRPEVALPYLKQACVEPNAQYFSNLSFCHSMLHNPEKAVSEALHGLSIDPKSVDCMAKMTHAMHLMGEHERALPHQFKMVELEPTPDNWSGVSVTQLLLSKAFDYEPKGEIKPLLPILKQFHARVSNFKDHAPNAHCGDPWMFNGAIVNVILEQGMGDCVMMLPYIKNLAKVAKKVNVLSMRDHDFIIDLIRELGCLSEDNVCLQKSENGLAMWQAKSAPTLGVINVWMMDLLSLGTPREVVGLNLRPKMAKVVLESMGRVGICWRGNPKHPNDWWRSMRFDDIKPFIKEHGKKLFNLQTNLTEGERGYLKECGVAIDHDLMDNRVLIGSLLGLDSVITVDTFMSHLAGALAVKCDLLLSPNIDWRWGLGSEKTVWYGQHRLLKQKYCGEWKELLDKVNI